jgi:hypothetical protein
LQHATGCCWQAVVGLAGVQQRTAHRGQPEATILSRWHLIARPQIAEVDRFSRVQDGRLLRLLGGPLPFTQLQAHLPPKCASICISHHAAHYWPILLGTGKASRPHAARPLTLVSRVTLKQIPRTAHNPQLHILPVATNILDLNFSVPSVSRTSQVESPALGLSMPKL